MPRTFLTVCLSLSNGLSLSNENFLIVCLSPSHVVPISCVHARRTKNNIFFYQQFSTVGRFIFPEAIIPIESSMGGKGIRIAHWLILLVYTFFWGAILFAWQRYRSKVFKLNQIADLEC